MISVVLDTNTLVSGFGWRGPPSIVVNLVLSGDLILVTSEALLAELERVLSYPKLRDVFPDPASIVTLCREVADVVEPSRTVAAVTDEPDNRVLEAAVEASAGAIVTGDAGLLALKSFEGVPVMTASEFLQWLPDRA